MISPSLTLVDSRIRQLLISLSLILIFLPYSKCEERNDLIAGKRVTVIDRSQISTDAKDPVAFGKRMLYKAIKAADGSVDIVQHWTQTEKKVYLLIGQMENRVIGRLIGEDLCPSLSDPEGVIYQWRNTGDGLALVVCGTDKQGLMYALTELAQRIDYKGLEALAEVENTIEFPENPIRGLDRFITDSHDDAWYFSEEYWQTYICQLAQNRFNRLTFITGYFNTPDEGFMVPIYPYLVKVPGFEYIKLPDEIEKTPEQYLEQLRNIAKISHEHGLEFVLGIWSHGVSKNLLAELPSDVQEYTRYCADGMRTILRQAPEIDGIHLRINYEAGVGEFGETAENFWKEIISAIGDVHRERGDGLFLDLRAKGLTIPIRQWTLETGMDLYVPTKYTWEAVGLPYHPTQMRQGELNMLDNMDKLQRYWAWYLLFGRLGYSSKTDPDVWERAFRSHYGAASNAMLEAYQAAGMVLPLVTSAHLTKHPGGHNWTEMDTGGVLFGDHNANPYHEKRTYQTAEPGDPGLFYRISDYVDDVLKGSLEGKLTPVQVSALYESMERETRTALVLAETAGVPETYQPEYLSNRSDLLFTADLASFHSLKTRAATDLVFYQKTEDFAYLRATLNEMHKAKEVWKNLVGNIEKTYYKHPRLKVDLGTWADRIVEVEGDVAELEKMLSGKQEGPVKSHWDRVDSKSSLLRMLVATAEGPKKAKANEALKITFKPGAKNSQTFGNVVMHYRHANMTEGPFQTVLMKASGEDYFAELPGTYVTPEYDMLLYYTTIGSDGKTLMHPGLFHPDYPAPYYIVKLRNNIL